MKLDCSGWLTQLSAVIAAVRCRCGSENVAFAAAAEKIACLLETVRARDRAVWWVGNGGSAAICSHLSQDLINRHGIRSSSLNEATLITSMANDYGYAAVFLRPLQTLAREGDLIIAISSSGCSPNILAVAAFARSNRMGLVTLSGFEADNPLWGGDADVALHLPSALYGQVETGHAAILHSIVEVLWLNSQSR